MKKRTFITDTMHLPYIFKWAMCVQKARTLHFCFVVFSYYVALRWVRRAA